MGISKDMHLFLDKVDASPLTQTRKNWYYKEVSKISNMDDHLIIMKSIRISNALKEEVAELKRTQYNRSVKGILHNTFNYLFN